MEVNRSFVTFFKIVLKCTGHAFLMMLICLLWLNLNYNIEIEKNFVQGSEVIKRIIRPDKNDYLKDFVFVDVSKAKTLIPYSEGGGVDVITDRSKLDSFFRIINRVSGDDYKYIVCDVLFDKSVPVDTAVHNDEYRPVDSSLEKTFYHTSKVIIPYSQDEDKLILPVFPAVKKGYVGYDVSTGIKSVQEFLKYQLIKNKSLKGLPVVLYEDLNNATVEKFMGLAWINGRPALNTLLVDMRIRKSALTDEGGNSKILSLDEMLNLLASNAGVFYKQFLSGKIIMIGDYENDIHNTAMGEEPGSIILANIYLSLLHGDTLITFWWFCYIFISFYILSWILFYRKHWIDMLEEKIEKLPLSFFIEIGLLAVLIWIVALISYIFFHHYINIVILIIYLGSVRYFMEFNARKKEKLKA